MDTLNAEAAQHDAGFWMLIIVGLILFVLIAYFFTRWILSIERQLKNQSHMVDLLEHIAKNQGVEEDKIKLLRDVYK